MSSTFIRINDHLVPCNHRRHPTAKRLTLSFDASGNLTVTRPWFISQSSADHFVAQNHAWITRQLFTIKHSIPKTRFSSHQLTQMRINTRNLVRNRLAIFNRHYQFHYHRITIRDQKTRWGSCSAHKTLSFNCRLILLPPALSDYVVVHELCHLRQMNHSPKFWQLVAQTIPDFKFRRRQLKVFGQVF